MRTAFLTSPQLATVTCGDSAKVPRLSEGGNGFLEKAAIAGVLSRDFRTIDRLIGAVET